MEDEEILQEEFTDTDTETESEPEPLIYVGPNLYSMALKRFQVFRRGLPPYVKRAVEKFPDIQTFLVPVRELEDIKRKISRPGTNESRLFDELKKVK